MARKQRTASSGAPGLTNKTSAGAPALNPLTYQAGHLDPNVAAAEIRANHPVLKFVGKELTPLPPLK
jgi:hypothetical protein